MYKNVLEKEIKKFKGKKIFYLLWEIVIEVKILSSKYDILGFINKSKIL